MPPSPAPAPPAPALRAPWAVANEDPSDDYAVGPPAEIADCATRLTALGVKTRASQQPVHQEATKTCGSPQVVSYESGPGGARWSSSPQVTCLVALALSRFETIVHEEAQRHFSSKVTRITHMGTYACRPMVRFNMASEHSFANAIDIGGFELQNGTRINVDPDWGVMTAPPSTPAARFLRTVAGRSRPAAPAIRAAENVSSDSAASMRTVNARSAKIGVDVTRSSYDESLSAHEGFERFDDRPSFAHERLPLFGTAFPEREARFPEEPSESASVILAVGRPDYG